MRLSRDRRRPLYEIEGLISFYPALPDRAAAPDARSPAATTSPAGCTGRTSGSRRSEPSTDRIRTSSFARCPASAAATARPAVSTESELRRSDVQRPNDPYEPDARDYRVLRSVLAGELDAAELIAELKESELRGMGGAGFPTGTKWELVAKQEAEPKYAICNADESEPGTFKDRQILAEQPHLVLEGLVLGMLATGCREGWVFIRHEYEPEEEVLREELERLRGLGLLDEAGVTVDIFVSPGGYILGEESALIECMEGHRGEPRNKPPFPGVAGLWGKPTLMNSVETFAHVPVIAERGADWWKSQGVNGGTGLKFFAVSGHVEKPDVYCVPDGHDGARADRAGGRRERGPRAARLPARRRVVELPRAGRARRAARLRTARGGGLDARLGRGGGDRRGHRPARRRDERAALLPQRVVREVRALPGGVDEGARDPVRPDRLRAAGPRTWTTASSSSRRRCG